MAGALIVGNDLAKQAVAASGDDDPAVVFLRFQFPARPCFQFHVAGKGEGVAFGGDETKWSIQRGQLFHRLSEGVTALHRRSARGLAAQVPQEHIEAKILIVEVRRVLIEIRHADADHMCASASSRVR